MSKNESELHGKVCAFIHQNLISAGALLAALSVAMGAFGAHALRGRIGYDLLQTHETASRYLMFHAIAIILYGVWLKHKDAQSEFKPWPGVLFVLGSLIFAGSLYGIVFTGIRFLGAITPIGGAMFILGWIGFAYQARKYSCS